MNKIFIPIIGTIIQVKKDSEITVRNTGKNEPFARHFGRTIDVKVMLPAGTSLIVCALEITSSKEKTPQIIFEHKKSGWPVPVGRFSISIDAANQMDAQVIGHISDGKKKTIRQLYQEQYKELMVYDSRQKTDRTYQAVAQYVEQHELVLEGFVQADTARELSLVMSAINQHCLQMGTADLSECLSILAEMDDSELQEKALKLVQRVNDALDAIDEWVHEVDGELVENLIAFKAYRVGAEQALVLDYSHLDIQKMANIYCLDVAFWELSGFWNCYIAQDGDVKYNYNLTSVFRMLSSFGHRRSGTTKLPIKNPTSNKAIIPSDTFAENEFFNDTKRIWYYIPRDNSMISPSKIKTIIRRGRSLSGPDAATARLVKNAEPNEDVHVQYCDEADAGIIRVITAPQSETFDPVITVKSPAWQKEACVALRRYLGRECDYGMSWDSSEAGWKDTKVHPIIKPYFPLLNSNKTSQGLIGIIIFSENSEGNHLLSSVWVHPFFRRKGVLKDTWPSLVERYGEFDVEHPNENMQKFLSKIGHRGRHIRLD